MRFRPCIDIHNGQVKQIVGGSLTDVGDQARENFVSKQDAAFFAKLYEKHGLKGGHIILLNGKDSPYYEATKTQAMLALKSYPKGMQIGGGINDENAYEFLEMGAQKIIVTSYVFKNGRISYENLEKLVKAVGKENLVLLEVRMPKSLRKMDRWVEREVKKIKSEMKRMNCKGYFPEEAFYNYEMRDENEFVCYKKIPGRFIKQIPFPEE